MPLPIPQRASSPCTVTVAWLSGLVAGGWVTEPSAMLNFEYEEYGLQGALVLTVLTGFAGVVMIEATKQIYAAPTVRAAAGPRRAAGHRAGAPNVANGSRTGPATPAATAWRIANRPEWK